MTDDKKGFADALGDLESASAAVSEGVEAEAGTPGEAAAHPTVMALRARFGAAILHHAVMAGDEHVVRVASERAREILQWLRDDEEQGYDYLKDLTAVDYGGGRPLELVYQLWSMRHRRGVRVKAAVALNRLEAATVCDLWATANWLEREAFDMFGIRFRDHPDLRRILMPESYAEGYPLRKDFPLRGRFTRAEQTRRALAQAVQEHYSADELAVVAEVQKHHRASPDTGETGA